MFTLRSILSLSVAVSCIVVIVLLLPEQKFLPSGILLPAKIERSAVSSDAVVVTPYLAGTDYELVGVLSIKANYQPNQNYAAASIYSYAKVLAAASGANEVSGQLLVPVAGLSSPLASYNFKGVAVYRQSIE